jgi:NAD(P)-dependent dehydrogenase (short-subunit alcohol dehydrogenase family)
MDTLNGKIVLVTGGARGLGAAICETLYQAGATVIAADIREELVVQLCERLAESAGANAGSNGGALGVQTAEKAARPMVVDVTDESQIEKAIQQIVAEFGRLDVLINNAAIDKTVSIEELEIEEWDRVMAVNLRAPFVASKLAMPVMRQQGSGHIVNIVSTAAKRAWANAAAYHASKFGLLGLTYALHVEARPHNVKVTAVIAGGMRTPFLLDRFPDIDVDSLQDPKNVADTIRYVLLQPDETVIPEVMVIPMRETSWP